MSARRPVTDRTAFALVATLGCLFAAGAGHGGTDLLPQPRMGDPLSGLTPVELVRFFEGREQYDRTWTAEEGLGPIFNKASCGNCHNNPIGGPGSQTVTRAGMSGKKGGFDPLEELGGSLFQQESISEECSEVLPPEADIVRLRVTPGMLGYGLVEAIDDDDIAALEDPGDVNGDFISGRVHWVSAIEDPPGSDPRAGRFGWKAQDPTMITFTAGAALNEIGLTNPFHMVENDPNGILPPSLDDPDFCDTVPEPEVGIEFINVVADFQRFLAAPPQTPKSGMTGEAIFIAIGCAKCHTPSFTTRDDPALEDAIRNKTVQPYSDFLLHDMGLAADDIPQGDSTDRELKTSPLMGLRTRDPLWHDGRFGAGTFTERVTFAILEHGVFGSEAELAGVIDEWNSLTPAERDQVIQFLDSLGRREFDADGDDDVQLDDFIAFSACYTGPGGGPYAPDDPCAISDIDQDGDVDLDDYGKFLLVYFGAFDDCNANGTLDITDVITGYSLDANNNGIPDECDGCIGDLDGNGNVGFTDLMAVLSNWGPCVACPQDIDGDMNVGFDDLLIVLVLWGPCA